MKKITTCILVLMANIGFAQLSEVNNEVNKVNFQNQDTINGWKNNGTVALTMSQSAFSNWVAGGDNNIAGNLGVNYNFNYKSGPWSWDNQIVLGYGLAKRDTDKVRKTNDIIGLNSLLGRTAYKNWSYSFFLNFKTQFTDGFNYDKDADRKYATSGLFKPAYLSFGPGFMWRKDENFKFNIAPVTSKVTFVSGEVWTYAPDHANANADGFVSSKVAETYGVEPGKSVRYEVGMYASAYYKAQLMENVSMENTLSLYSNYLDKPQNVDVDYLMNVNMQINKYLSTNLTVQLIYDDNAVQALQLREIFGMGVNLNF